MPRARQAVLLNDVQHWNLEQLQRKADDDGVLSAEVMGGYKQNVINALVRRKVLKASRGKAMRLTGIEVRKAA